MKKFSKSLLFLMVMIFLLSFTACGQTMTSGGDPTQLTGSEFPPEKTEYNVTLYYMNEQFLETGEGDELKAFSTTISSTENDVYKDVIRALQAVPSGEQGLLTCIGSGVKLLDAQMDEEGLLSLNFDSKSLGSEGTSYEQLFIEQVTKSYFDSFPDVKGIQFQVDGCSDGKTLMGNYDISDPFVRESDADE